MVIPLAMQHGTLHERNLMYTAVTVVGTIIGQPRALVVAVWNRKSYRRPTKLAVRIEAK